MACCWTCKGFRGHLPARAATDATALAAPDLVLVCVKSADTEAAGRSLAGRLRPDTSILSLQNGVDNAQRLRSVTGHAVIAGGGLCRQRNGRAGPCQAPRRRRPRDRRLAGQRRAGATLRAAGIATTIADDIEAVQWTKLITNCAFNALSAVAGIAYGPMMQVDGAGDVIASAIEEAAAVARACGVALPRRPRRRRS